MTSTGVAHTRGGAGAQAAGGVNGFKLVGMALGLAVHSRALGYTMGAYGAGMSVYSGFIARGHEVVFPEDPAMEIGIGRRNGNVRRRNAECRRQKSELKASALFIHTDQGGSLIFED